MIRILIVCLFPALAALESRAASPRVSTPATDPAAAAVKGAGPMKNGMAVGADKRPLDVLFTRRIESMKPVPQTVNAPARAPAPAALTISPAEFSLDAGGKVAASAGSKTIKLGGVTFKTGDVVLLKFSTSSGSWTTTMNIGSAFQFTTALPKSPVTLAVSGQASASSTGADISMSSVGIKYRGVVFLKKCEWTVDAAVTSAGIHTAKGNMKFVILPGAPVP